MARSERPMKVFQGLPWCTSGWDFPSNAWGEGSVPGQGPAIPHASWPKTKTKNRSNVTTMSKKDFKNGPHQKKILKKNVV